MKKQNKLPIFLLTLFLVSQMFFVIPATAVTINSSEIAPSIFSPDGNGLNDTITITVSSTTGQSLYANFFNQTSGVLVAEDCLMTESPSTTYKYTWNGKNDSNGFVQDGIYTIRVSDNPSQNGDTIGTVQVDTTPPSSPSLLIDGGAAYAISTSINLTVSATGASQMEISNYNNNFANATWETFATTKQWMLPSSDGTKIVYINLRDIAGANVSTSATITLDRTISDPSLSINSGANSTNTTNVVLTITASDAAYMKIDNDTLFTNMSSWITKTSTYNFTLASGADGLRTVYLIVKDDAGNTKTTSDSITLDTTAPTNLSLSINSGSAYTNSTSVNLTVTASGGAYYAYFSNTNVTWTRYDYTTSANLWILTSGDGIKTIYYKAADDAGNNATAITATITLDTTAPTPVQLSSPTDGDTISTQMPTLTWTNPNPTGTKNFVVELLQSGTTIESSTCNATTLSYTTSTLSIGIYSWKVTIYDMADNAAVTSQYSFTISISGLVIPTPLYSTSGAHVNGTAPFLVWSTVSGDGVKYTCKYGTTSACSDYSFDEFSTPNKQINPYVSGQTIYWKVNAYNHSNTTDYSTVRFFIIDTEAPVDLNITINSNSNYTSSASVTLTLSATNATMMMISNNASFNDASWETYTTTKSWTLPTEDGTKTVYFKAKDNAVNVTQNAQSSSPNIADTINAAILLDTTASTVSNQFPASGATTTNTLHVISADLSDGSGSGVDNSTVVLLVDTVDQTANATIDNTSVMYTPSNALGYSSHTINITVPDQAGNIGYSEWSFTVQETSTPPTTGNSQVSSTITISNLHHTPTTITSSDTVNISATIVASAGVHAARLCYSYGSTSTSKAMNNQSNSYSAVIGPFPEGTTVTYYINVTDNEGYTKSSETKSFAISDTTKPTITIVSPVVDAVITDRTPEIKATFTDTGGINSNSVIITVDDINVTASSTITSTEVTYMPATPLSYKQHTVHVTVSDTSGNTATTIWSFTVQAEEVQMTKTITILKDETQTMDFQSYDTAIQTIQITASTDISSLTVTCTTTGEKPSGVTIPPDAIYLYLVIETNADTTDISSAVIKFKIEKQWLTDNNIDKSNVKLLRYANGWQELATTTVSENETFVFYQATTTGFSSFAIVGKPASPLTWILLAIGIIILMIIIVIAVLFKTGRLYIENKNDEQTKETPPKKK
ncbi:MAG: PGF-pre-PGF domain-containing protein [Euryarchaeota archaeon]|nr:PGF-pre-PGF domain-containing protein [Euryarchaeota archaeon]